MQSATVTATIFVVRDSSNPVFNATDYRRTISENQAVNTFVVQVYATDSDLIVSIIITSIYHQMDNDTLRLVHYLTKHVH